MTRDVQLAGLLIVNFGGTLALNKHYKAIRPTESRIHINVNDVQNQIKESLNKCKEGGHTLSSSAYYLCIEVVGSWFAEVQIDVYQNIHTKILLEISTRGSQGEISIPIFSYAP